MKLTDVPLQAVAVAETVKQFANDDERQKDFLGCAYDFGDSVVSPLQMRVRTGVQENPHFHMASSMYERSSRARSISTAS